METSQLRGQRATVPERPSAGTLPRDLDRRHDATEPCRPRVAYRFPPSHFAHQSRYWPSLCSRMSGGPPRDMPCEVLRG